MLIPIGIGMTFGSIKHFRATIDHRYNVGLMFGLMFTTHTESSWFIGDLMESIGFEIA